MGAREKGGIIFFSLWLVETTHCGRATGKPLFEVLCELKLEVMCQD